MNIQTIYLTFAFLALLLSSCTSGGETDGNTLPDGKYPLIFTSSLEAMVETRAATAEGSWTEGDQVAVKVGEEVKEYSYGADKTFTSDKPFYWTDTEETKTVSAWYPYSASTTGNDIEWSVQPDQNADENYQQSDFLYAPEQNIEFKDETKSLAFYHQTARVVINIMNADVATDASQIAGVVIGDNNNLALSGIYTAPSGTDVTADTWDINSGSAMGTIIPKDITDPTTGFLKTYTALVIPQDMDGKPFIKVTIGEGAAAREYVYTPEEDKADLEAGNQYTYNITVKKTGLEVTAKQPVLWNEGNLDIDGSSTEEATLRVYLPEDHGLNLNINRATPVTGGSNVYTIDNHGNSFSISYTPTEGDEAKGFLIAKGLGECTRTDNDGTYTFTYSNIRSDLRLSYTFYPEVGDYYYSDGTFSPKYTSGSDPACIGIVFKVGAGEGDDVSNYPADTFEDDVIHGYVVALENTTDYSYKGWGNGIGEITLSTDMTLFLGYANTDRIEKQFGDNLSTMSTTCYQAVNYTPATPVASAKNSGWYLPSLGEYNALWQVYGTVKEKFTLEVGSGDMSVKDGLYWTSSREPTNNSRAAYVPFAYWDETKSFQTFNATSVGSAYVRPVLTF